MANSPLRSMEALQDAAYEVAISHLQSMENSRAIAATMSKDKKKCRGWRMFWCRTESKICAEILAFCAQHPDASMVDLQAFSRSQGTSNESSMGMDTGQQQLRTTKYIAGTATSKPMNTAFKSGEHETVSFDNLTEVPKSIINKKSTKTETRVPNFFKNTSKTKTSTVTNEVAKATYRMLTPSASSDNSGELALAQESFFSYRLFEGPDKERVHVHYIRTFNDAEENAKLFLHCTVIGFDTEFGPQGGGNIKKNVSLIQVASETDIALFHIALFEGETPEQLVPPALKKILGDKSILKTGSKVGGDASRVEKNLGCEVKGTVDLKTFLQIVHKEEKGQRAPLDIMTRRYFGLGLDKNQHNRCSDWMHILDSQQIEYAASDAYASLKVFQSIDVERQQKRLPPAQSLLAANDRKSEARKRKASKPSAPTLYDALHTLRATLATRDNIQVWEVMTNQAMKGITAAEPVTDEQLCEVFRCRSLYHWPYADKILCTVAKFVQERDRDLKRRKTEQGNLDNWLSSSQSSS